MVKGNLGDMNKKTIKNSGLFILGFGILIVGIALILVCWSDVVALFRGAIGFVLAMAGLLTLYSVKELK